MNTREKVNDTRQKKSQKIKSKSTPFLAQSNSLHDNAKNLICQHRLNRKKAENKKRNVIKHLKQQYYQSYGLLKEDGNPQDENKRFFQFIKAYDKYSQLHQQKQLTFQYLCKIATQIQLYATKENSVYLKEFSQKIFMQMYSMVMSHHPKLLEVAITVLVNSIFQLMLDPIRHEIKLQQYARKMLLLITANKCQEIDNITHAAPSIWKLCLLASLHDTNVEFIDLFKQADRLLDSGETAQTDEITTSELQTNVTCRMKQVLNKQAIKDLVVEYRIGPYVVDIAFPSFKLIVEIDGVVSHHQNKGQRFKDDCKDMLLARHGWDVIRIPSYEYYANRRYNAFEAYIQNKLKDYPSLLRQPQHANEQVVFHHYKLKKQHNPKIFNFNTKHERNYHSKVNLSSRTSTETFSKVTVEKETKKTLSRNSHGGPTRKMLLSFEDFPKIVLLTRNSKSHIEKLPLPTKKFSQSEIHTLSRHNIFTTKAKVDKKIAITTSSSFTIQTPEGAERPSYKSVLMGNNSGYFENRKPKRKKNKFKHNAPTGAHA